MNRIGFSIVIAAFFQTGLFSQTNLDATFNGNGKVLSSYPMYNYSLALQGTKILIAGETNQSGIALLRYTADGILDNTFGNGGLSVPYYSSFSVDFASMIILPDEKILISARGFYDYPNEKLFVMRLLSNGAVDSSFGVNGIALNDNFIFTNSDCVANPNFYKLYSGGALGLQADGKIVQVGTFSYCPSSEEYFYSIRYTSDGLIDTSFHYTVGLLQNLYASMGGQLYADGIVMREDSSFLIYGLGYGIGSDTNTWVPRYIIVPQNGQAVGLGGGGILPAPSATATNFSCEFMKKHKNSYVIGGSFEDGGKSKMAIARIDSGGSFFNSHQGLDTTFGADGYSIASFPNDAEAHDAVVLPDNKIVIVGGANSLGLSQFDITLVRLNEDGAIDNSFGINGVVSTDFTNSVDDGYAIVRQADGKLVVAGFSEQGSNYYTVILRYSDNQQSIAEGEKDEVVFFPNPVTHSFHVNLTGEKTSIVITDLFGQVVSTLITANRREIIDVSAFPSGIYLISIQTGNVIVTKRIMKD